MKSLKEIVQQLRSCGFTCEAGPLENNEDFQLLEVIAGLSNQNTSDFKWRINIPFENNRYSLREKFVQERRDEIIEKAKGDLTRLLTTDELGKYYHINDPDDLEYPYICVSDFVINKNKRTIVALMKGFNSGIVRAKGISKCDPTDCFNVHIGKAIALRRALGLEVPAEYLNAPQPTEVRVGDKILYTGFDPKFDGRVETVSGFNHGGHILTEESPGCIEKDELYGIKIIDDSRE